MDEHLRDVTVGPLTRLDGPVTLVDPDPGWPQTYAREAARIAGALGAGALLLEHVGSTSVPGLVAKPIIDIVLAVADSTDEAAYRPALEGAGYVLRLREPDWFEHRLFRGGDPVVNLHVFTTGAAEIERTLLFRNRLRADAGDRERYAATKRELAGRTWRYLQDYADAKSAVIEAIIGKVTE